MPKVSIVKCSSYEKKKVHSAITKALKDINFEIKPKTKVLLKPNVLMGAKPEKAITTNPMILDAVCKILEEKKCMIIIAESFGVPVKNSEVTFKKCGILDVAKKYNARLLSFSADNLKEIKNDGAVFGKSMMLPELLFDVDLIINLPKFKTHTLMMFTGAVKNLFGCIAGGRKQVYHAETKTRKKFANLLLDIWENVRPGLTIIDAVVGMEGNGPAHGNLVKLGFIMASDNAIALDLVAEDIINFKGKILTNNLAIKRKLINKNSIKVIGKLPEVKFRAPSNITIPNTITSFFLKRTTAYPKVIEEKCKKCWTCVKVCPTKAMGKKEFPECNKKECIACYCCQEMCPYGAIGLKTSFVFAAIVSLYNKFQNLKKSLRKN